MAERFARHTRCVTRKGAFTIPAALFEDGREGELAYHFASRMPAGAKSAGRTTMPNGDVVQRWRMTWVVPL